MKTKSTLLAVVLCLMTTVGASGQGSVFGLFYNRFEGNEQSGSALISVIRTGDTLTEATVEFATSDGTAGAGTDYIAQTNTVTFASGEIHKFLYVDILDDDCEEGPETVVLTLRNPSSGGSLGAQSNAVLRIQDDETRVVVDPGFNPTVGALGMALQPDGRILIFSSSSLMRLKADGSLDASFSSPIIEIGGPRAQHISAIALQSDGKMLVSGFFGTVNGVNRGGMARLNSDGSLDTDFLPAAGFLSQALASQADGKILFAPASGWGRFGRLNADGSLDSAFDADVENVSSTALQPDGKIIIGGAFTSVHGVPRNGIARLNADGSLDPNFDAGAGIWLSVDPFSGTTIWAASIKEDGNILIAGSFTHVDGVRRNGIARLHDDGSLDMGFNPPVADTVKAMAIQPDGGIVMIGRDVLTSESIFGHVTTEIVPICQRVLSDGTLDTGFNVRLEGLYCEAWAIAAQPDGQLVIGGTFESINGVSCSGLGRIMIGERQLRLRSLRRLPDGTAQMRAGVIPGRKYVLQSTSNLADWVSIRTNLAENCTLEFQDTEGAGASQRFYRALLLP